MARFRKLSLLVAMALTISVLPAAAWEEPARGSADRDGMMDAIRPYAVWLLGKPVEFQVIALRMDGDIGFAMLTPQRPGGGTIDLAQTPMVLRDAWDMTNVDGAHIEVLYQKSGNTWVAVHWQIGATDVWWAWDAYCDAYRAVIAEACS